MGTLKTRRVLVTGATGMTGRHLLELLAGQSDVDIVATSLDAADGILRVCDLSSFDETERLLTSFRPACIYHCAGTFSNRWETDFAGNVVATKNLLEGLLKHSIPCRLLAIGSAAEYGRQPCPPSGIREDAPLRPVSVYGLTKAFQTQLLAYYHRAHGANVVLARSFNLYGAGCSPALFPGRVLQQIQELKAGRQTRIIVGNLEARRDYLPVSQAVAAYRRVMERGMAGEVYNVGSGISMRVSELLDRLLTANGLERDCVQIDSSIGSASADVGEMFADITKLNGLG